MINKTNYFDVIKNWTVTARQIRNSGIKKKYIRKDNHYVATSDKGRVVTNGFINHVNYLVDKNRSAHQNTHIHVIYDNAKNILSSIHQRQEYRTRNSIRGGGVVNWATSFCLSLPASFDVSKAKWKGVVDQLIEDVSDTTGIDVQTIRNHTHAVLHDESRNIDKHSHVHILIGNVIDLEVVKSISQKKTLRKIKNGFNISVMKFWNVDNNSYIPENQNVKNKPLWLARQEKLVEQEIRSERTLAEYHEKVEKANKGFALLVSKLKKLKKSIEKWSYFFLQEQFILAANFARPLAKELKGLENNSRSTSENLLKAVSKIEEIIPHAPASAKVSNKIHKHKP